MIDWLAVRSLIAIEQHGSVVRAAEALGFTPSAVSQQIKRLEAGGRTPMLERVGRGVVLTERARLLVHRGGELLHAMESLERLVQSDEEVITGTYRLATFATASRGLVAPALARIEACAPELHVAVLEHDPWEAVSMVTSGRVDVAVVHDWTSMALELPHILEAETLLVDRADVLVHRDHPLAHRSLISTQDVADQRWVGSAPGTICHSWLLQMHATHHLQLNMCYSATDFATHIAMVSAGVAIALVPRLGRTTLPPDVVVVEIENPVPQRAVRLIWRRSAGESPTRTLIHRELGAVAAAHDRSCS